MNEQLGEAEPRTIEACQPGDVFEYEKSSMLAGFEDKVAKRFITDEDSAKRHYETWEFRENLADLIRPDKDYGTIHTITATVIPDAYERVFDFKKRGKRYKDNKHPQVRSVFADRAIKTTVGFEMTFETKKGQYCTEVYYLPIAENSTTGQRATSNTGGIVHRYVARSEKLPVSKTETEMRATNLSAIGATVVKQCVSTNGENH